MLVCRLYARQTRSAFKERSGLDRTDCVAGVLLALKTSGCLDRKILV